jgi:Tfp pilus assembly protein PilN
MKRLHLDLAPFSIRRELHRIRPAARALALAALLSCMLAVFQAHKLLARLDTLDQQTARLDARAERLARLSMAVKSEPIDAKQGEAVNTAVARLNLPWNDILDALEAATPSQVAVLSITPETGRGLIRIEAESSGSKDIIDYLNALEQQPLFVHVNLIEHELAKDGTDGVMRFAIEAQWREAKS